MTAGAQQRRGVMASVGRGARRKLGQLLACGVACGALLGCGARSALSDLDPAGSAAGAGAGGACGTACEGTCTNGRCLVTLANAQMNAGCIAVDASNVFWAVADPFAGTGAINRISHDGGPFSTISTTRSTPWPCSMALDAMYAYWADGSNGSVLKARVRGGVALTLARESGASAIAIDGANVYFTGQSAAPTKVPLGGGAPMRLADSHGGNGVAIDATSLYWTVRGTSDSDGSVNRVSLSGGAPTTLAAEQGMPGGIAADESSVYWANYASGTIQKVSHDGGAVSTLASGQETAQVIAIDNASVYFATSTGTLAKVPKAGGATTILAASAALDIALDATSVYWTDGSAVLKLTPK